MKELSIEQKAKAYDKAIKRVENIRSGKYETTFMFTEGLFEHIFPELVESEDERIRKAIITLLNTTIKGKKLYSITDTTRSEMLAWLEKQGEQKPSWSEEDEENLKWFEKFFRAESVISGGKDIPQDKYLWLKSIKDRVQPQPKQEWSEEDYNEIETISCHLDNINNEGMAEVLRSIRDKYYLQSTWKPSGKQMTDLAIIIGQNKDNIIGEHLKSLYEDLKKLREE